MSDFVAIALTVGVIAALFSWILGLMAGGSIAETRLQNEAVAKGFAEWFVDENNQRQWRWKPPAEKE